MAIQVSGVNVIDDDRNFNVGILTATSLNVPPQVITFSPTDGSSDVSSGATPQITFNTDVQKGSGNITLRDGSASGSIIQTIAVSSGAVSISGGVVTTTPPSLLPAGKNIFFVVDAGAFESTSLGSGNNIIDTYNFSRGPITVSSFSPADNATDQSVSTNIVITFSENIAKGSGNITIRSGSASGTILQTIDVTSGAVSVSGTQATINPPSDLAYETAQYIVVDAGCFTNTDGDAASGNTIINDYNITTESDVPPLGSSYEGGYLICCSSGNLWIVAPSSTEVGRDWYSRNNAVTTANANAACGDWFVPTCSQLQNPGYTCRSYWDSFCSSAYWSNSSSTPSSSKAWRVHFSHGASYNPSQSAVYCVRAFRCVSY